MKQIMNLLHTRTARTVGWVFFGIFLIAALGYAGRCDRRDAARCAILNNGFYQQQHELHPDWDEERIITLWIEQNN